MPDRLGWICPRCFTAVSPDCADCAACSLALVRSGPFKPDESGVVFAPMRADLTATPRQVADLETALAIAAHGMLGVRIVVLPPGSKVLVPADEPGPARPGEEEAARCDECGMPLTMHHEPGCSQPCGRCAERKAHLAGQARLTVRLPAYMGDGAVQVTAVTGTWAEVLPGLEACLRSVRTGSAEVEFRVAPPGGGQAHG